MTLLYSPSIANLFVFRGIMGGVTGVTTVGFGYSASPTITMSATIYSGIQPSAATITSSWSSYNSNYLFHQPGITYNQPSFLNPTTGGVLTRNNSPTAVTATNSGTANWCIIWCSNVAAGTSAGQIGNSTLPNANFIVGAVTIGSGNGIVTLSDLNVTGGSSVSILDSSIKFYIS